MARLKSSLVEAQKRAFTPVDIASLVFFRIVFGLLMVWEVCRYFNNGWVYSHWLEPRVLFKYCGFSWVHPWPAHWLYVHWAALGVLALFVAAGFLYRVSAPLMFLSYAYFFLLDEVWYVNHTYLICLFCFLMIFVPAHRALSIEKRPRGLPLVYTRESQRSRQGAAE
jgi:vitamin K-dependent gamma-carboxylase